MKSLFKKRNFTLIELMTVISIIAILTMILLPSLKKAKEMARESECLNNTKQLSVSFSLYTSDHHTYPPPVLTASTWNGKTWKAGYPNWAVILKELDYIKIPSNDRYATMGTFTCPSYDQTPNHRGGDPAIPAAYSSGYYSAYVYNSWFTSYPGRAADHTGVALKAPGQIKYPSNSIVIGDGDYSYMLDNSYWKRVSYRHENYANFLFADGHALKKRNIFITWNSFEPYWCTGVPLCP